jgi:hypothetical protein
MTVMKPAERAAYLGRFYFGDVMYAYVWLRRETMGDALAMEVTCVHCQDKGAFPWKGSLSTVEVVTVDDEKDLEWSYTLRSPIDIRGKRVTHFRMTAPRWNVALETKGSSEELARLAIVRNGVTGLNDEPTYIELLDSEMDEVSRLDLELLTKSFDDHHLGPNMSIEGNCPHCDSEFKRPINWKYDNFFGASSV